MCLTCWSSKTVTTHLWRCPRASHYPVAIRYLNTLPGTVEGGRQSGSSVKSNEQTNFMSMVSKTLLPPELMQAGKGRRQSVDLGLVFRKPLYETGSFAAAPKRENRQIERKQKTPSGSSAGAGSNSPAEDDINDGARGGSSTSGGGSVSGGGKRKPSVKTEDGTDYSEPVLMTGTLRCIPPGYL